MSTGKYFYYFGRRYTGLRRFTCAEAANGCYPIICRTIRTKLTRESGNWTWEGFMKAAREVGQSGFDIFLSDDGREYVPASSCLFELKNEEN